MSSNFDAVIRKSGNSLVITIPYNISKAHGLKPEMPVNVTIQKMGEPKEEK